MKSSKRYLLGILLLLLAFTTGYGQGMIHVTGVVKDTKGELMIGVQVVPVGATARGGLTDMHGKYSLTFPGSVTQLAFSYMGYKKQTVTIDGRRQIDIVLQDEDKQLTEVVVTALGIKRASKALSYNVQQVKTGDLLTNKDANFINALSGKVAGVNINSSSSGIGGATKVIMRGVKSISQSSNALYVIDGVPLFPQTRSGGTEFASQGSSEPIADINPEDIESMSVLTGAAAAALYGSAAANGAVVITTKQGKEGKIQLTVGSTTEFMHAFVTPRFQSRYGTGSSLSALGGRERSWGDRLTSFNSYPYDPVKDYFQTGLSQTENLSLSVGTKKNQTYLSGSALTARGIIPNNGYRRFNLTLRNTTKFLDDKMTLDLGASYIYQTDRNMINQGVYGNPLVGAYLFPRGDDWRAVQMYRRYSEERKLDLQYWPSGDAGMTMQNPYWINYRNLREHAKNRYMLHANLAYQFLPWLSLSGRVRLDHSASDYTERLYAGTNTQLTEGSDRGYYHIDRGVDQQLYADLLLNINRTLAEDLTLQANVGTSLTDMRSDLLGVAGPIADGTNGEQPGLANFFAIQHLSRSRLSNVQDGWREQTQSLFASAELGYRSTYYLTLTGRNDWPSQLAGPKSVNSSFFYPSVGVSVVLSELLRLPQLYNYLKLRGSYASVGAAFPRFLANPHYAWQGKQWSTTTAYPVYNLKPERTDSWEIGLSGHFLKHFDLDVTYYSADTHNQTFDPQLGAGGSSKIYIQTGAVRNRGVELSLSYKNHWGKLNWNSTYTFSTNENKILELARDVRNPLTGEVFSLTSLDMGGLGEARFLLKEGGSMTDLYSRIDLQRDQNGKIYVGPDGKLATQSIASIDDYIKLGNTSPKASMAWRNSLSWNGLNLSFLLSARLGGIVFSRTQAILDDFGVSEASAAARDFGYSVINGRDYVQPELWYGTIGGGTAVPQYYTYSATNVRLQEASIGYTLPRKWLGGLCDLRLSVVGRNLLMLYSTAPFDPQAVASTGSFYDGIDYFMMPSLRSVGLNVQVQF